jgi:hypothetical protein
VSFGATEHDNVIAYQVSDNGVGFDMAFAHKLFMPFERLHCGEEFPAPESVWPPSSALFRAMADAFGPRAPSARARLSSGPLGSIHRISRLDR